jgi:uncharacterized Fe-S center protein
MAKVFFTDMRTTPKRSLLDKLADLLKRTKLETKIKKGDLTAVKLHFGEMGNTAYLRPVFLRVIVDRVKALGGKPFLTDTNTLYTGSRSDSVSHLTTAVRNGFDYAVVDCPLIIADGLRGKTGSRVEIDGHVLKEVGIAAAILEADALIVVTHFKGHELSGFGGAIKNLGMGCATREGKLEQHSTVAPSIHEGTCVGCRLCTGYCPAGAISVREKKATISPKKCIGCGECIIVCPVQAIQIQWNESPDIFQKKMAEYALGALRRKEKKTLFVNFVMQVSPACDCYPNSDAAIVRDLGILASDDPVAIDTASSDLVNGAEVMPNTAIRKPLHAGDDKWRAIYPSIDWNIQLDHAERLGMGTRSYTLVKI